MFPKHSEPLAFLVNCVSFSHPVDTRQALLGGTLLEFLHPGPRSRKQHQSYPAGPRGKRGPPPASPRGPEVLCSPALVENKLVNTTRINRRASLCDTFKQIGCNWLNGIPSKSWSDLLPPALLARGERDGAHDIMQTVGTHLYNLSSFCPYRLEAGGFASGVPVKSGM